MSSNFEAYLAAVVGGHQEIEDNLVALLNESVDDATSYQLDVLGRIVGEPRDGAEDDPYRRRVRARVAANRSSGTPNQLLRVLRLVLGDAYSRASGGVLTYANTGGAGFDITLTGLATPAELADICSLFLDQAKGSGLAGVFVSNEGAPADHMYYDVSSYDDGKIYFDARRT